MMSSVSLTIESLVEDPLIRTHLVAGNGGLGRMVTWAHTCEVADPWNWLGSGELLMTDGYSFPSDPAGQVAFVQQLAHAQIAGLALAEGFAVAPLTPEVIAIANELDFPILVTARNVPFVTIARAVGESHNRAGSGRATQVLRLYDILRRSQGNAARDDILKLLGDELRVGLHVIDLVRGRDLLATRGVLPEQLRNAALERFREQEGRLSAFNRLSDGEASALLVPVGTRDNAALVVRAENPDLVLTQHVAMIAELEVERREAKATRTRERGANLIRRMLDGSIDPQAAAGQLRVHGMGGGPWRVMAWHQAPAGNAEADASNLLVDALTFVTWAHLHAQIGETHMLVIDDARLEPALELGGTDVKIGVSQPLASIARVADAFREARWALESAHATGEPVAVYGSHGSYFMPNTVAEGEVAVRRLLGPILDYDAAHDAQLVESLRVYFEVNRSWQEGARRLGIHKQTLVYRIKKIEEVTGADMRDFGVQAEMYLALRTWSLLNSD
jgi:purine catabolism regulator